MTAVVMEEMRCNVLCGKKHQWMGVSGAVGCTVVHRYDTC